MKAATYVLLVSSTGAFNAGVEEIPIPDMGEDHIPSHEEGSIAGILRTENVEYHPDDNFHFLYHTQLSPHNSKPQLWATVGLQHIDTGHFDGPNDGVWMALGFNEGEQHHTDLTICKVKHSEPGEMERDANLCYDYFTTPNFHAMEDPASRHINTLVINKGFGDDVGHWDVQFTRMMETKDHAHDVSLRNSHKLRCYWAWGFLYDNEMDWTRKEKEGWLDCEMPDLDRILEARGDL